MKLAIYIISFLLTTPVRCFVPLSGETRADARRIDVYARPLIFPTIDDKTTWSSIDLPQAKGISTNLQTDNLNSILESIKEQLGSALSSDAYESLVSTMKGFSDAISMTSSTGLEKLSKITSEINAAIDLYISSHPALQPLYEGVKLLMPNIPGVPNELLVLSVSMVAFTVVASSLSLIGRDGSSPAQPYPLGKYDPISARDYFKSRFPEVVSRALQIAISSLGFGLSLLLDYIK